MMFKRLAADRRGTIALITAIVLFPLLFLAVGVPIDLARAIQYRAALQNIADTAALAGSEVIGVGANPSQACTLTLAYANIPALNGEIAGGATATATLTAPGGSIACGSATSTPQTTDATAPNEVSVTMSGTQPTTFLSFYKSTIPIAATSSVIGPPDFITICDQPNPNPSGDLSQAYYYLRNTDGTFVNEDGSAVTPSSYGPFPGESGGVATSAFLGDDDYVSENPPTDTDGYCDATTTPKTVAIEVKPGLAQRLGFAYYVITNGQTPCYAVYPDMHQADNFTDFACLKGDENYPYDVTNISGFFDYYQENIATNPATGKPYLFLPNVYGSPVGWVNIFYSTDYPASLNTNNYYESAGGAILSPVAGDTCFTTYDSATSNVVKSVVNGYTGASQSCLALEASNNPNRALTVAANGSYKTPYVDYANASTGGQSNEVFWSSLSDPKQLPSIGGTTNTGTDLVCMVANGQADTTLTESNKGKYSIITKVGSNQDQQENLVIANSSVAPNVYRCPVDTVGNPFYPDPTCAELNGATLQIAWNDMGGILYDNGNYVDLHYSYSCRSPTPMAVINSAIIQ